LTAAAGLILGKLFPEAAIEAPTRVRIACALPQGGAQVLGQCWHGECSADGTREITVSAMLDDLAGEWGVLAVLTHELLHAALPEDTGHKGAFAKALPSLGLEGPPTSTIAGEELRCWFAWSVMPRLGRFPHASLNPWGTTLKPRTTDPGPDGQPPVRPQCKPPGAKPQRNRQLLYQCPECGQKIRAAGRELLALCPGQIGNPHDPALFVCQAPAEPGGEPA